MYGKQMNKKSCIQCRSGLWNDMFYICIFGTLLDYKWFKWFHLWLWTISNSVKEEKKVRFQNDLGNWIGLEKRKNRRKRNPWRKTKYIKDKQSNIQYTTTAKGVISCLFFYLLYHQLFLCLDPHPNRLTFEDLNKE